MEPIERAGTRTDDEVAFGIIPCRFSSEVRYMRTLKINAAKEWKALLGRKLAGTIAEYDVPAMRPGGGSKMLESLIGLGMLGTDTVLELVVAYDKRGTLGGSEWLGENADDAELYAVFRSIFAVHFPFVRDVLSAMGTLAGLLASGAPEAVAEALTPQGVESPPPSSSSGASRTGASAPTRSRPRSTKRN